MSSRPIYLDNAATTAVDPRVIAAMNSCLGADGDFANPSSASHVYGRRAGARVEQARAEVAALVNAAPSRFSSPRARRKRTTWRCSARHGSIAIDHGTW